MTDKDLHHFLLVYDLDARTLKVSDLGEDAEVAAAEYSRVEEQLERQGRLEIVLIGADSIETIRKTHAHYFEGEVNGASLRSRLVEPSPLV